MTPEALTKAEVEDGERDAAEDSGTEEVVGLGAGAEDVTAEDSAGWDEVTVSMTDSAVDDDVVGAADDSAVLVGPALALMLSSVQVLHRIILQLLTEFHLPRHSRCPARCRSDTAQCSWHSRLRCASREYQILSHQWQTASVEIGLRQSSQSSTELHLRPL